MKVFEMLVPAMPSEKVQFGTQDSHRMSISCHWDNTLNIWLDPGHAVQVKNVDVIKTLVSIITTEHV